MGRIKFYRGKAPVGNIMKGCPGRKIALAAVVAAGVGNVRNVALGTAVSPFNDNLGYQWESTSNEYNVGLVAAKNTATFVSTTPTILVQEDTLWETLDPVTVNFSLATNPDPASPAQLTYFTLAMDITNLTGVPWSGFTFTITDGSNTDYPNQKTGTGGSLLHPDRSHFHVDTLLQSQLGFTTISTTQKYYNSSGNLVTNNPGLDTDQGVYSISMSGGMTLASGASWQPMSFVPQAASANTADLTKSSLLEFHDKNLQPFSVTFQPIPTVPEPATLAIMGLAAGALLLVRRRSCGGPDLRS